MELIVIALIIGIVIFGLERNKRHTAAHSHLAGSSDIQDRDVERLSTDLVGRA
jgi:hypothetical protein